MMNHLGSIINAAFGLANHKARDTGQWMPGHQDPKIPFYSPKIAGQCSVLCADIYGGHCAAK